MRSGVLGALKNVFKFGVQGSGFRVWGRTPHPSSLAPRPSHFTPHTLTLANYRKTIPSSLSLSACVRWCFIIISHRLSLQSQHEKDRRRSASEKTFATNTQIAEIKTDIAENGVVGKQGKNEPIACEPLSDFAKRQQTLAQVQVSTLSSAASVGLTDCSQVDVLGTLYRGT